MRDDINPDYNEFSAADFALDEFFIQWVLHESPEANRFWSAWLKANPSKSSEMEAARALVLSLRFQSEEVSDSEISTEWHALRSRINDATDYEILPTYTDARTGLFTRILRIAAVILLGASLIYFFIAPPAFNSKVAMLEYTTRGGQKMSLMLPDGSAVILNSNSRIAFPERFSPQHREIHLEGEAYFDVQSDSIRPFSVQTDNITTVVLGTSFNIRAYPDDEDVGIALVEGRVRVDQQLDSTAREFYLRPSEMLTMNRADTSHTLGSFHSLEILGWKDGVLFFNKSSFPDALSRIERWYGVKIEVRPGVKLETPWRFNGKFQNQSIDEVLKAFSYPGLFKYRITDDAVVIYEGG